MYPSNCIREYVLGSSCDTRDTEDSDLGSTCAVEVDKQSADFVVDELVRATFGAELLGYRSRRSTTGLPFAKVSIPSLTVALD